MHRCGNSPNPTLALQLTPLQDVLARRTRLAFLNAYAAFESLPLVISVMSSELGWSRERCEKEYYDTVAFLTTMGLPEEATPHRHDKQEYLSDSQNLSKFLPSKYTRAMFLPSEITMYRTIFTDLDSDNKGYIHLHDVRRVSQKLGVDTHEVNEVIQRSRTTDDSIPSDDEVIKFEEFLEILSTIKEKKVPAAQTYVAEKVCPMTTDRSGGGV
jgi:hypothetical protein